MSKKMDEREIEGHQVRVTQFPATFGIRLFSSISKSLLPAISGLITSIKSLEELDLDNNGIMLAVEKLVCELEPDKSEKLIKDLLSSTKVNGEDVSKKEIFDTVFQGEYGLLIKSVAFAFEVNYRSFLPEGGLKGLLDRLPLPEKQFQSPNT